MHREPGADVRVRASLRGARPRGVRPSDASRSRAPGCPPLGPGRWVGGARWSGEGRGAHRTRARARGPEGPTVALRRAASGSRRLPAPAGITRRGSPTGRGRGSGPAPRPGGFGALHPSARGGNRGPALGGVGARATSDASAKHGAAPPCPCAPPPAPRPPASESYLHCQSLEDLEKDVSGDHWTHSRGPRGGETTTWPKRDRAAALRRLGCAGPGAHRGPALPASFTEGRPQPRRRTSGLETLRPRPRGQHAGRALGRRESRPGPRPAHVDKGDPEIRPTEPRLAQGHQ